MTTKSERIGLLPIGAITVLAAVARIAAIRQPMRFDESISWAYYVGRSWFTIITSYSYPNNHVFYSLLAKLVASPFNYQPWALRLPAFLAGVAIIPLVWAVGRRLADERSALVGAALAAGSTALALFSTNARGYTLVTAFFLALLLVADHLLEQPSRRNVIRFAVIGGLGLYAIPTMMYPLGVVALWAALNARFINPEERRPYLTALGSAAAGSCVIAAVLYAPIMVSSGITSLVANKFVAPSDWDRFVLDVVPMITETLGSWVSPWPPISLVVILPLALVGAVADTASKRSSVAAAAVAWCGVLMIAMHRTPFARVWLFLLPLFFLAVARGIWRALDAITRTRATGEVLAALLVTCAMVWQLMRSHAVELAEDTGLFRPGSEVAALIGPQLHAGDRILAPMPSNGPVLYYITRAGFDSSTLNRTFSQTRRAFLVLDTRHEQTLDWAVANGIVATQYWKSPTLLAKYPDAEVWMMERNSQ